MSCVVSSVGCMLVIVGACHVQCLCWVYVSNCWGMPCAVSCWVYVSNCRGMLMLVVSCWCYVSNCREHAMCSVLLGIY